MEDPKLLEIILRSLLMSTPKVLTANKVLHDFEDGEGIRFPFRKLGFSSFVEYLKSIPTVVKLVPLNSNNPEVHPVGTKQSKHIDLLVTKQKSEPSKRSGRRDGNYMRQIPRRRPASVNPLPINRQNHPVGSQNHKTVQRQTQNPINSQTYHAVDRQTFYHSNRQTQDPTGGPTFNSVYRQVHHSIDGQPHHPVDRHPVDRLTHHPVDRPSDLKQSTNFDKDFLENIQWDLIKKVASSKNGIKICDLENELKYKYHKDELERNGIYSARDLLNQASPMVECYEEKVFLSSQGFTSFPGRISITDHPSSYTTSAGKEESYKHANCVDKLSNEIVNKPTSIYCSTEGLFVSQMNNDFQREGDNKVDENDNKQVLSPYDCNSISTRMISNFRKILEKYPEGILASELPEKYCEEFGVDLDISDLGFSSAINMVTNLPNVFTHKRIGESDWRLYDACKVKQSDILLSKAEAAFSENLDEKNRYIPKRIFEDIKSLVEQYSDGFRSTDLLRIYECNFNRGLDLEKLGFDNLEDFLQILKNIITVQKVTNYYLLLPKHSTPLKIRKSESSVEILKLPTETFSIPLPEHVVKITDNIPSQGLPPVNDKAKRDEPLFEIEIRVAEVMSPENFYFMLSSKYNELQIMMDDLDKFYRQEEDNFHIPCNILNVNLFCACKYEDSWHRVKITKLNESGLVNVDYIDYGTPAVVKTSELRFLQKDFAKLPTQAICAKLMGVKPLHGGSKWPKETCKAFLDMVSDKRLLAQVYTVGEKKKKLQEEVEVHLEVLLYDTTDKKKDIIINEDLVDRKLAQFMNVEDANTNEITPVLEEEEFMKPSSHTWLLEDANTSKIPPALKEEELMMSSSHTSLLTNNCQRKPLGPPPGFAPLPMHADQQPAVAHIDPNLLLGNTLPNHFPSNQLKSELNLGLLYPNNEYFYRLNDVYNPTQPIMQPITYSQTLPDTSRTQISQTEIIRNPSIQQSVHQCGNFNNLGFNFTNSNNLQNYQNVVSNRSYPSLGNNFQDIFMTNYTAQNPYSQVPTVFLPSTTVILPAIPQHDVQHFTNPQLISHEKSVESMLLEKEDNKLLASTFTSYTAESMNLRGHCSPSLASSFNTVPNTDKFQTTISSEDATTNFIGKYPKETIQDHKKKSHSKISDPVLERVEKNPSYKNVYVTKDETKPEYDNFMESKTYLHINDHVNILNSDCKKTPDSWENIELDDTPYTFSNFVEGLNNPVDFDPVDKFSKAKVEDYLTHESKNWNEGGNWKDFFNPDTQNELKRCDSNLDIEVPSSIEILELKKELVQKIEINEIKFHLICVNNKLAVLSHEFYPQVASLHFLVLTKILGMKNKKFDVIHRSDNNLLFSKLEKIEFCDGLDRKQILKLGRASISYLTDIPEMFITLNLTDEKHKSILKKIKMILHYCVQDLILNLCCIPLTKRWLLYVNGLMPTVCA